MFWYLAQSSTIFHKDILLWVRIPPRVRCTHYLIKFVSDLRQVGVFSPTTPVSYTNKTDRHDITELLLKVALNTINHKDIQYEWTNIWYMLERTRIATSYFKCLSTSLPGYKLLKSCKLSKINRKVLSSFKLLK
jgi:hypothetical protein